MREEFWKELNEARSKGTWQLWKNAFPEASALDMTCLVEINQYISISGGKNAFVQNQSLLGPVQTRYTSQTVLYRVCREL